MSFYVFYFYTKSYKKQVGLVQKYHLVQTTELLFTFSKISFQSLILSATFKFQSIFVNTMVKTTSYVHGNTNKFRMVFYHSE